LTSDLLRSVEVWRLLTLSEVTPFCWEFWTAWFLWIALWLWATTLWMVGAQEQRRIPWPSLNLQDRPVGSVGHFKEWWIIKKC